MERHVLLFSGIAIGFLVSTGASGEPVNRPWSFAPLEARPLPEVENGSWPETRLDHFVLAKLEAGGLSPAPAADARSLARRLHFDLLGLPPEPEAVTAFSVSRTRETIDRLLASPHCGERWGRYWLDLARYTDTTASWLDSTASAWHYRDWVVRAFNEDLPYDEFVRRQLATDLIAETPPEDNAALGFFGLSPTYWKELQLPPEIIRTTVADEWEERIDTLGRTFLGLTLACARCHDHKSDPVSVADYYALAGVFASVRLGDRPMMDEELWVPVRAAREKVAGLEKKKKDLEKKKKTLEDFEARMEALKGEIEQLKRTPHYDMPTANGLLEAAVFVKPKEKGHGTRMDYQAGKPRDLAIQNRGDPNDTGEVVARRFLSAFPGPEGEPRTFRKGSGRLELAEAILEDARPLVARVIVNRVWKHHFGRGIVATPSDFGNQGSPPTHPALLDDLAHHFVENGWSIKWLHREILNSATWKQASVAPESERKDPDNRLYGRMTRRRLDVESFRDSVLFVSGSLDRTIGGKPVDLTSKGNVRRTLYGNIHRRDVNKMLQVFDFPDPAAHGASRSETTTPLQILFSLNSPFILDRADVLAKRVAGEDDPVASLYRLLFQRPPLPREKELADQFLSKPENTLSLFSHALLCSNEFLYLD